MPREVSMNYEVGMGSFTDGQVAVLESKVQAIALLEARVKKLEDKNKRLRELVYCAVEADPSMKVMGGGWHADARRIA